MVDLDSVSKHWSVSTATVRSKIRSGALRAVSVGGRYRTTWPDIWACEAGRRPGRHEAATYMTPLLTISDVAAGMAVSRKTVERWIESGLPTRRVGVLVRMNRCEVDAWMRATFGTGLDDASV